MILYYEMVALPEPENLSRLQQLATFTNLPISVSDGRIHHPFDGVAELGQIDGIVQGYGQLDTEEHPPELLVLFLVLVDAGVAMIVDDEGDDPLVSNKCNLLRAAYPEPTLTHFRKLLSQLGIIHDLSWIAPETAIC